MSPFRRSGSLFREPILTVCLCRDLCQPDAVSVLERAVSVLGAANTVEMPANTVLNGAVSVLAAAVSVLGAAVSVLPSAVPVLEAANTFKRLLTPFWELLNLRWESQTSVQEWVSRGGEALTQTSSLLPPILSLCRQDREPAWKSLPAGRRVGVSSRRAFDRVRSWSRHRASLGS